MTGSPTLTVFLEFSFPEIDEVIAELRLDRPDGFVHRCGWVEAQLVKGRGHDSRTEPSQIPILFGRRALGILLGGQSKELGVLAQLVLEAHQCLEGFWRSVLDQNVVRLDPGSAQMVGEPRPYVGDDERRNDDRKGRDKDGARNQGCSLRADRRVYKANDLVVDGVGELNELQFFHQPRLGCGPSSCVVFRVVSVGSFHGRGDDRQQQQSQL